MDDRRYALLDVANEAEKLQRIIENLLLLSRVEAGQHLESEPLRLTPLIAQAIAAFQRRNPKRPVSLHPDADLPPALGQPAMLGHILDNLIANADKYSPADSAIEILVRREADNAEVCVRDYGIGLPEGEAEEWLSGFPATRRSKIGRREADRLRQIARLKHRWVPTNSPLGHPRQSLFP